MPTSPVREVKRATNVVSRPTVQVANSRPNRPPAKREQRALGQQLTNQAAAPGAERRAHGELAIAAQQARERQVGDVGAGDQQDEPGRPEQDQQHRPRVARQLLAHADGRRREARAGPVRGLVVRGEAPADDVDVRRRRARASRPASACRRRSGSRRRARSGRCAARPRRGTDRPRSACRRRSPADSAARSAARRRRCAAGRSSRTPGRRCSGRRRTSAASTSS